jgi:hypothetical protein
VQARADEADRVALAVEKMALAAEAGATEEHVLLCAEIRRIVPWERLREAMRLRGVAV